MNSKRPWILAAAGAVAATAATVVAVTVLADDPVPTSGPATSPTASATSAPTTSPSSEASPTVDPSEEQTPSDEPVDTVSVPVYFVGDQPAGPRLFREFHRMPKDDITASQVAEALRAAMAGAALDPDYRSDWPAEATTTGVTVDGSAADDIVWVDLEGDVRDRPGDLTQEEAEVAVQQLVHTAQAVLQQRQPIQFTIDGERTDTVLGVPTSEPVTAANPMEVQAPVWIIVPQHGDTVDRTFVVDGRGIFFEANVSWQLLQDGEVVDEGFTTAQDGMSLASYSFEVTAEPGDYVLRVYDADMSGGEGNGEAEDTKAITVE